MAELPASPLPRDPEYWEELARRIGDDARTTLAAYGSAPELWYGVIARRAPWLAAASAAAMMSLWVLLPAADPPVAFRWMERSVSPDEIAGTLVGGRVPPRVDALMAQFPPEIENE